MFPCIRIISRLREQLPNLKVYLDNIFLISFYRKVGSIRECFCYYPPILPSTALTHDLAVREAPQDTVKNELTFNSTYATLNKKNRQVVDMAKSFGQALRELRRSKDITQRDLSMRVGVDFSYISKVENDRLAPPSADTIVKICEVLEVSPDELLALTGKMPTEVKEMISANRAAIKFVRKAHAMGLTDEEWEKLTQRLKRLRSG